MYVHAWHRDIYTIHGKILVRENIEKFGKSLAIHQHFPHQY